MSYYNALDASSLDPDSPTIFELISARQLNDLISPSLRYVLVYYAQRHPRYLLRVANKFDEIYALIMALVEYYHLKNFNATLTEKFYGIKRAQVLATDGTRARNSAPQLFEQTRRLSKRHILGALFFAIGVPYIKTKLQARFESLSARYLARSTRADREAADTKEKRLRFAFDMFIYHFYPIINAVDQFFSLAFSLGYLFGQTRSSLSEYLLGLKLARISQYDATAADTSHSDTALYKKVFSGAFSLALPTSMFVLKFLEWWSASDFARQLSKPAVDSVFSPPSALAYKEVQKEHQELKFDEILDTSLCPLCGKPITNPTAIETGIVYCYSCIHGHLQNGDEKNGGRCPVTGQKLLLCKFNDGEWILGGLRRLMV